ncbi:hypothetical protein [Prosthecomicrobium hirschii]|uniref:apolipoprotein A-IV repeat region-like domain-containing protein n=2 Tax=Prosthecodimorpha hirschii TaxID=665126 RepID=UPI00221FFC19|nr:hypothetical protein [Prosthecomicrobium hirschii]MCW1842001.1 hypothetical protein [Prosthecomicrobium hirschii]
MSMSHQLGAFAPVIAVLGSRDFALVIALGLLVASIGWYLAVCRPRRRAAIETVRALQDKLLAAIALDKPEARIAQADATFAASPFAAPWIRYRSGFEIRSDQIIATIGAEDVFRRDRLRDLMDCDDMPALIDSIVAAGLLLGALGLLIGTWSGAESAAYWVVVLAVAMIVRQLRQGDATAFAVRKDRVIEDLIESFGALANHVPRELVALRQLRASEENERQLVRLRDALSESIGGQVSKALHQHAEPLPELIATKIASSISSTINPLISEITRIGATMERNSNDFATRAGDGFVRLWREATQAETDLMNRSLRSNVEQLEQIARTVQSVEQGFGSTIELASQRLLATTQHFGDMMDSRSAEIGNRLDQFKTVLGELPGLVTNAAGEATRSMAARLADVDRSLARIPSVVTEASSTAIEAMKAQIGSLEKVLSGVPTMVNEAASAAATSLKTQIGALDDSLSRIPSSVVAATDRALIAITSGVEETSLRMQDVTRSFNDMAAAEMERQSEQITVALGRAAEQILEATQAASGELRTAGEYLGLSVVDGSRLVGESAESARSVLSGAVEALEQQIVEFSGHVRAASAELAVHPARVADAFEAVWGRSVERQLEIVAENIRSSASALESMSGTVRAAEQHYAQQIDSSASGLNRATDRLEGTLASGTDRLNEQLGAVRNTLADLVRSVGDSSSEAAQVVRVAIADLDSGLAQVPRAVTRATDTALDGLSARLREIETVLQTLPGSIAASAESAAGTIGTVLNATAEDVRERTRTIGQQLDATVTTSIGLLQSGVEAAGDNLRRQAEQAAGTNVEAAQAIATQIRQVEAVLQTLPTSVSTLTQDSVVRIGAAIEAAAGTIGTVLNATAEDVRERTRTIGQQLDATVTTSIGLLQSGVEAAGDNLRRQAEQAAGTNVEAAQAIATQIRQVEAVLQTLPTSVSTLTQDSVVRISAAIETAAQGWETQSGRFSDMASEKIRALSGTLIETGETLVRQTHQAADINVAAADTVAKRLHQIDETLQRLPATMSDASQSAVFTIGAGMTAAVQDLKQQFVSFTGSMVDNLASRVESLGRLLEEAGQSIARQSTDVAAEQAASSKALVGQVRELEAVMAALPATLRTSAETTAATVGATLDRTSQEVLDRTRAIVETLASGLHVQVDAVSSRLLAAGSDLAEATQRTAASVREAGDGLVAGSREGAQLLVVASSQLREDFAGSVQSLKVQVDELSGRIDTASAELARQPEHVANTLGRLWEAAVGRQITLLSSGVSESVSALSGVATALKDADKKIGDTVGEAARVLMSSSEALDDALFTHGSRVAGQLDSIENVLQRIPQVVETSALNAVKAIDLSAATLNESVSRLPATVVGATTGAMRSLREAVEDIEATLRKVPVTIGHAAESSVAGLTQSLSTAIADLRDQHRALAEHSQERFAALFSDFAATGVQFKSTIQAAGESLTGAGVELNRNTSQSIATIGEAAEVARTRIDDAVSGLGRQIDRLANRLELASAELIRQPERMSETLASLWQQSATAQVEALSGTVRAAVEALETVVRGVSETGTGLTDGINVAAGRLEAAADAVDSVLATSAETQKSQIVALGGIVETIPDRIFGVVDEMTRTLRLRIEDLDGVIGALPEHVAKSTEQAVATIAAGAATLEDALAHLPVKASETAERSLVSITAGVEALARKVQDAGRDFTRASTAELELKVRDLGGVLDEAGQAMVIAMRQSAEEFRRNGGILREDFAAGMSQSVERIAHGTQLAATQLQAAVEHLDLRISALASRIDRTAEVISATGREIDAAGRNIAGSSGSIADLGQLYDKTAEPLAGSIAATKQALDQVLAGLATVTDVNQRGAEALQTVALGGNAAREFFETQGVRIADLDAVISGTLEQLRESMRRLSVDVTTELRVMVDDNRQEVQEFLRSVAGSMPDVTERSKVYMR